ncbi:hypothetical protein BIY29_03160 [Brenneria alni]|uniref:Uncharacterized protein n=1 Tax=Brenneria alni TaxID=71656 RepID=A0A421DSB4_9GAMM|nr:hypothetical protein [Brenneria alni]RLM27235.1 hypothetical protein BIY29_03160 [Brenneria alni]
MDSVNSAATEWLGFHGTSLESARGIVHGNYRISTEESEWLGHGAYFFIAGLNEPRTKAMEWAKFRSWDKTTRTRKYARYAVLQSKILTATHLDLDDPDDQRIFEAVREKCTKRMRNEGFRGLALENDCYLANFAMSYLGLDALVRKEAIQTRVDQPKTRIPNCRIMCVKFPDRCVSEHRIIEKGKI